MPRPAPLRLDLGAHARVAGRDLSGVAAADGALFVAPDEGAALLRLTRTAGGWGAPVEVPLADAVALPGDPDDEVDAEGLDLVDGCLWVVGSHSAKRKGAKKATAPEDVARRLATARSCSACGARCCGDGRCCSRSTSRSTVPS